MRSRIWQEPSLWATSTGSDTISFTGIAIPVSLFVNEPTSRPTAWSSPSSTTNLCTSNVPANSPTMFSVAGSEYGAEMGMAVGSCAVRGLALAVTAKLTTATAIARNKTNRAGAFSCEDFRKSRVPRQQTRAFPAWHLSELPRSRFPASFTLTRITETFGYDAPYLCDSDSASRRKGNGPEE